MSKEALALLAGFLLASVVYAQSSLGCGSDATLKDIPAVKSTHIAKPLAMHAGIYPIGEYTVLMFSPDSWITFMQADAKRTLSTFSPNASDMKDILRVAVTPPQQLSEIAQGDGLNISVVNVVMRSTDHSVTVSSLCSAREPVSFQNSYGAKWTFNGMFLLFDQRDIRKQLAAGKRLEISVVVGTGKIHDFTLPQKQLSVLGLE